ncbi:MAG: glutamine amidotransferase [Planctomycetaceae bacterium]
MTVLCLPTFAGLVIGDNNWLLPAVAIGVVGVLLALWVSRRQWLALSVATSLRVIGWLLIVACLVNPLWSSARPRRGANVFAVLADVSRSQLVATDADTTRADEFSELLEAGERTEPNGWLNRIDQDFELRRYLVSERLERVDRFGQPEFNGAASNLQTALRQLKDRFINQPLAGTLLLTDGNATDFAESLDDLQGLPPVFPVVPSNESSRPDVAVGTVSVAQTAFDDAPVTLQVQVACSGLASGQKIQATLLDDQGLPLETLTRDAGDDSPLRFRVRPEDAGTVFYRVNAELLNSDGTAVQEEATTVNNQRLVAVDRGSDKRRVLYVSGRPNWEFKFFRRATETDPQVDLVGLIRIAKKEAKFDFRGRENESSNSLLRGFDEAEQEVAEEYDEPVLVRLGTEDEEELLSGFPEKPEDLFKYDAIILDDMEAGFFLADQLQLIYEFVSKRGGGLLMTGGQESFRNGEYDRTPVGEMLPIDLHREGTTPGEPVRLSLTRDGWLQPWVRLRSDEAAEEQRLGEMPGFHTLNPATFIRPGAVIMATVHDSSGVEWPALVVQRFGRGRSAALCIGDLWRWRLHEGLRRIRQRVQPGGVTSPLAPGSEPEEDLGDYARACRQMIRFLVADVPKRLNVSAVKESSLGLGMWKLVADVKDRDFEDREDATVTFRVTRPGGEEMELAGEPSVETIGRYEVTISALDPGPYVAQVTAELIHEEQPEPEKLAATMGWASQPDQEEMASVGVDRAFLQRIADATGGRVITTDELPSFVEDLSSTDAPIVEIWSWPVWHQWWVFAAAVCCFMADWTIRRRQGMP